MYRSLFSRDPLSLNRAISLVDITSFRLEKLKARDLMYNSAYRRVRGKKEDVAAAAARKRPVIFARFRLVKGLVWASPHWSEIANYHPKNLIKLTNN